MIVYNLFLKYDLNLTTTCISCIPCASLDSQSALITSFLSVPGSLTLCVELMESLTQTSACCVWKTCKSSF